MRWNLSQELYMLNEIEYAVDIFIENFKSYKQKRIVLYGKGPVTPAILEACPAYNIIGIMDRTVKDGMLFGKPVYSFESGICEQIDLLVLITRPHSLYTIYQRIQDECARRKIPVFNIRGENLDDKYSASKNLGKTPGLLKKQSESMKLEIGQQPQFPYFSISEQELKAQIDCHEAISFDIFDTLIMRKVLYPRDVFDIIASKAEQLNLDITDFRKFREEAERFELEKAPNIYQIYDRLQEQSKISDQLKFELLALELETEKSLFIRRGKMVELMRYAIQQGKQVCLISDMYLPVRIIQDVLDSLEITGYCYIFVSCEYHAWKSNGLYEIYKKHIRASSYLHIGDNKIADGEDAVRAGLDTFLIQSARDMLNISRYSEINYHINTINDRSLVGLTISRLFNDPFTLYQSDGKKEVCSNYEFGYFFIAPLITDLVIWLIDFVQKADIKAVLFCARDGFLIQELYLMAGEILKMPLPKAIYLLISRYAVTCATVQSKEDIRYIAESPGSYSVEEMLQKKFGLDPKIMVPYSECGGISKTEYALKYKEQIYKKSAEYAAYYRRYLEKIGVKEGERYALFDLVVSGTCQYYLGKLIPLELTGYALLRYDYGEKNKRLLNIHSRFPLQYNIDENSYLNYLDDQYLFHNYILLEGIITSCVPTLIRFTENGEPVYEIETRGEEELKFIKEIQKSIKDFFRDYIGNLHISSARISRDIAEGFYRFKDSEYTNEHCKTLDHFCVREDMGGGMMEIKRN